MDVFCLQIKEWNYDKFLQSFLLNTISFFNAWEQVFESYVLKSQFFEFFESSVSKPKKRS